MKFLARGFDGKPAVHSDWVDHLSTLFPEVRLKKFADEPVRIGRAGTNHGASRRAQGVAGGNK